MIRRRYSPACIIFISLWIAGAPAVAGVVNPNISVIGQPYLMVTDDPANPDHDRLRMDPGETEVVFDDYLNPFTRGYFTLALNEDGLELEEGWFRILHGLPGALNLKGGKWRQGFGKLNAQHPHTYPFFDGFHVLSEFLPGDESFNESGLELSERLPSPGESSLVASLAWLQGDSFRQVRGDTIGSGDPISLSGDRSEESRPAVLGRLSAFSLIGERSGLDFGLSATSGTNNVAAGTRTTVYGADAKAKLWNSERSYLVLQAEVLKLDREDAGWSCATGYAHETVKPWGWYIYGDYNWDLRWNAGASFERYQAADRDQAWNSAFGLFGGVALMEETTAFRVGWERFRTGSAPGDVQPDPVNTFTLRVIFSMGPHKTHQF